MPIKCSITKRQYSETFGVKIDVRKGGPYQIVKFGKGWFIHLFVPENRGTNAKEIFPVLYEDTDFLKSANEYYKSLDDNQKKVTYQSLSQYIKYLPIKTTIRNQVNVKSEDGISKISRRSEVIVNTVYNDKSILIEHNGSFYKIDPRDTYVIYDIRNLINPKKTYVGNDNLYVSFPQGEASFADRTKAYHFGSSMDKKDHLEPLVDGAIGSPDKSQYSNNSHLTGCKGLLTLEFVDNVAINGEGPDIYVFHGGKQFYPMEAYVSSDYQEWIQVNNVGKSVSTIELGDYISEGQEIRFVKLIHLGGCSYRGNYIDAVGAINTKLISE